MRLKFRIALMFLLLAVLFCGLVFWTRPKKEPVYNGKPLSYWLTAYDSYPLLLNDPRVPTEGRADQAIRKIGTNAIPFLMEMLQAHDWTLEMRFYHWADKRTLFGRRWHCKRSQDDVSKAMSAFEILGMQRADLLPQLTQIYDRCPNPFCRQAVVAIATYVAPQDEKTLPLFSRAVSETNDFLVSLDAVFALNNFKSQNDLVVRSLIEGLTNPDRQVQEQAAWALCNRGTNAILAVPKLVNMIKDKKIESTAFRNPPPETRGIHFRSYRHTLGDAAEVKRKGWILSSSYPNVRFAAIKALESIDPDTAAKLEAQKN